MEGIEPIPIVRLAQHLLTICPNSASCERIFSSFGLILTKLRNRLKPNKLLELAELKMHLRDDSLSPKKKEDIRKRAFGIWSNKDHTEPDPSTTSNVNAQSDGPELLFGDVDQDITI